MLSRDIEKVSFMRISTLAALLLPGLLAGCDRKTDVEPPPRATDRTPSPTQISLIAVPIGASTASLKQALDRAVPRTLWTINRRDRECVNPHRVKLFGKKVEVTPPIACPLVGRVTRGPWTPRA